MTVEPENEPSLPLEELELTPEWVKAPAPSYRSHQREDQGERRHGGEFPGRARGPRPGQPPRERGKKYRGHEDQHQRPPRAKTASAPEKGARPPGPKGKQRKPGFDRAEVGQQHERGPIESAVEVTFLPEEKAVASIIDTMKLSRRAYAFFDVAKLVLNKPERHQVKLARKPAADGSRAPLHFATATENVFLSQEEASQSIFRRHLDLVCKETKTPVAPPKGNFVFVNRCGLTGELLGPPNYHEYQSRLIRHHQQRLAHVPFEKFKANIQTVRDPEAVKAWADSMSVKTEYECILDGEPTKFGSLDELQKHVVASHLDKLVSAVPEVVLSGQASRKLEHNAIHEAIRLAWQSERRFPLKTANQLQARLRQEGFHFFKHDKAITYVSAIRPRRFEAGQELTEHVRKIVAFLRTHENCRRQNLLAHFLSSATVNDQQQATTESNAQKRTEELLLADLHWLIQDGYLVEFGDGRLWALEDKPPKPAPATPGPTPAPEPVPSAAVAETNPETSESSPTAPPPTDVA